MLQETPALSPPSHSTIPLSPQLATGSPATFQLIMLDGRRKFLSSQKCLGIEATIQHLKRLLTHETIATISIRRVSPKGTPKVDTNETPL